MTRFSWKKGITSGSVFGALLVLVCWGVSGSEGNSFQDANLKYREGKFSEAVELYEQTLRLHPVFEVFYNLGNAYFKNKQIGKAILNYERALKLKPRDRDIRFNLNFVNRFVEYEVEDKRNWHLRSLARFLSRLTGEECLTVSLIGYFVLAVQIFVGLIHRKRFVLGAMGFTLLYVTLSTFGLAVAKYTHLGAGSEAVIMKNQAEVRYGPDENDRLAFRLPEGLKVFVKKEMNDWYRIELLNGQSGWAMKSQISVV